MRLILLFALLLNSFAFAAADLELKSLKGVPEPPEMDIEMQIQNNGPDTAKNVGLNIYLYAEERLVLSQVFTLASLEPHTSRKETLTLELPNQPVTTVKVEVFDSQQPDIQPSTNFLQINIKPPDLRKADLQIVEARMETPMDKKDKGRGLYLRLRNNGPDKVSGSKVYLDLKVFDESIAKAEKKIDRLASGEEIEIRLPVPNAQVVPANNGTLMISLMAGGAADPDESNNTYRANLPLTLRMPDLIPAKAVIDKQGVLTFLVMNKGNARGDASITALYINGALVQRYNTPEMSPRSNQQYRYNATKLSSDTKVAVVVDFNADVSESSEENNRLDLTSSPRK